MVDCLSKCERSHDLVFRAAFLDLKIIDGKQLFIAADKFHGAIADYPQQPWFE